MTSALSLIAAATLLSAGTSMGIVQVSEESREPQAQESQGHQAKESQQEPKILQVQQESRESQVSQGQESRISSQGQEESRRRESQVSQTSSIIESEIIPFVRSGGTAIVPVRDAFRCKLLRLRDEDVVPREKIGCVRFTSFFPSQ